MSSIDHIFLFLFSFLLLYFWGVFNYKKDGVKYWLNALFPLLIVSIIIGSRTWGADYLWYKYQFQHAFDYNMLQEQQPLFVYFNRLLNLVGCNYVGGFTVYSLIYFIATFKLFKSFGKYSQYMYAFALPAYIGFGTDIIRQTIATGLVIFVILEFNKNKYVSGIIFLILASMIHSASIVLFIFYLFFKIIYHKTLPCSITIPLYIIVIFIFKPEWLNNLNNVISVLNFGDSKFQGYIDDSDRWFSEDANNSIYTQGLLPLILNTGFVISFFYLGYQALKKQENKDITIIYNIVVLGYIGLRLFYNVEILRRFFIPNTMLYPVVLGFAIYIFKRKLQYIKSMKLALIRCSFLLISVWLILYWGRWIFMYPEGKFFWN